MVMTMTIFGVVLMIRTLEFPLKCPFHHDPPELFKMPSAMTLGGISTGSAGINLSKSRITLPAVLVTLGAHLCLFASCGKACAPRYALRWPESCKNRGWDDGKGAGGAQAQM
jgi:hypothetical protein